MAHLALSAARADNFYQPPDWDPSKQSLDKYHGQHKFRDRAKKIGQGILIIRFEMPFGVICEGCGATIGKGVRFNAEKKQVGNFHSTKLLSFTMQHHCGKQIEVRTDPENTRYVVEKGAQKKVDEYDIEDANFLEYPQTEEELKKLQDPVYIAEIAEQNKQKAKKDQDRVKEIKYLQDDIYEDEVKLNSLLRKDNRKRRKEQLLLEQRQKQLGLPENIKLQENTEEEYRISKLIKLIQPTRIINKVGSKERRNQILEEPILPIKKKMKAGIFIKNHKLGVDSKKRDVIQPKPSSSQQTNNKKAQRLLQMQGQRKTLHI